MANTNRPTNNTHQQVIIPPNGDAVLGRENTRFRYYNNYPIVEKQLGQDPQYFVRRRPPCMITDTVVSVAPYPNSISSTFYDDVHKSLWFVNNRTPTFVFQSNPVPIEDVNRLTEFQAGYPPAFPSSSIAKYSIGTTSHIVVHASAPNSSDMHYYSPGGVFDETVSVGDRCSGKLIYMDGYLFIASNRTGQRIYNSTLGNPKEWLTGASFIDAEMGSDLICTLAKHHNHLVAFGRNTIEFFYNSANEIGSPLTRQVAYAATDLGLYATGTPGGYPSEHQDYSMVEVQDVIYFIGASNGVVQGLYKIDNLKVSKVSDTSFDLKLRTYAYPRLGVFDLNGELCVLLLDQQRSMLPLLYIPSLDIAVEFQWAIQPTAAAVCNLSGIANTTALFHTDGTTNQIIWGSGQYDMHNHTILQQETISSQYMVDYIDFNNNARKHWKFVDVLGSFGGNQVAIGYRNDSFGFNVGEFVNLPYKNASTDAAKHNLRFRNLGNSRRQGYTVFVNGPDEYLYKGVAVGYNQWGD